jgi:hypothetical protein
MTRKKRPHVITSAWTDEEVNEAVHQYHLEQSMKEYLIDPQQEGTRMAFLFVDAQETTASNRSYGNQTQFLMPANPWKQTSRVENTEATEPQNLLKAVIKGVWGMLH